MSSTVNSVTIIIFLTIKIIPFLFYKYHYPMFLLISICVYKCHQHSILYFYSFETKERLFASKTFLRL